MISSIKQTACKKINKKQLYNFTFIFNPFLIPCGILPLNAIFFFHLFLQCLQSQKTNNFRTTRHPYRSSIPTPDIYSLNKNLGDQARVSQLKIKGRRVRSSH